MIIIDEALIEKKNEGKLQSNLLDEIISISRVFHDSCHLTRPHNVIDPLRRVLHLIGGNCKEFSHFGKDRLCYGVDRALRIMNPELVVKIGLDRDRLMRQKILGF